MSDRDSFMPWTGPLLACLGCGAVIADDDEAVELHTGLHHLLGQPLAVDPEPRDPEPDPPPLPNSPWPEPNDRVRTP